VISPDEAVAPTLARIGGCMTADPALGLLARGHVKADGVPLLPSGIDALACCLARPLLSDQSAVAMALPRGSTGLPVMVGLYLVMHRWALAHIHGSVLVASARGELSAGLRDLTVEGVKFSKMKVGRLVSRPKAGTGGNYFDGSPRPPARQAMMRPLDRSVLRGLSQNDGYLLFARPGSIPTPPAAGVIGYAVVDTAGASRPAPGYLDQSDSPDAWTSAHRAVSGAGTRTLWLGELGDADFEAFCAARAIPLVRIGWELAAQAAGFERFGEGGRLVSSRGLCRRAVARPPLDSRVVHDPERDRRAREAYVLLAKMRREARGGPLPAPVKAAYKLLGLTSRLACTLEAYERAAAVGSPMFNVSARALHQEVRQAESSQFRGRWKEAYRRHWDSLVGSVNAICRMAADEPQKLLALFDELADAQAKRRELLICCQTETERRALTETLEELEASEHVTVSTFARRAPAGDGSAPRRVVMLGPPPPWQAPALLSGEEGSTLALCYLHEEHKLHEAVAAAELRFGDDRDNATALDALKVSAEHRNGWHPQPSSRIAQLPAFGDDDEAQEVEPAVVELPDSENSELWRELVDLWGSDVDGGRDPDGGETGGGEESGAYSGLARLASFVNAPPVALRDDRPVDVIADADGDGLDDIVSKLPGALAPGEHIAFLPGVEQHSLRDALMAAWDDTLATERQMFEPLWRAAITQAVARHGVAALAVMCDRHEATVRSWSDDRAAPQQPDVFETVLRASGHDAAFQARAPIWRFLQTTRTMHRIIGKKLRAAVSEALSDAADQHSVAELEALTSTPVGDLLDIAEELVVATVGAARPVALADCGHYLNHDHPLLQGATP
jgi:hypothetical protein